MSHWNQGCFIPVQTSWWRAFRKEVSLKVCHRLPFHSFCKRYLCWLEKSYANQFARARKPVSWRKVDRKVLHFLRNPIPRVFTVVVSLVNVARHTQFYKPIRNQTHPKLTRFSSIIFQFHSTQNNFCPFFAIQRSQSAHRAVWKWKRENFHHSKDF